MKKIKRLTVDLPLEKHIQLKTIVAKNGITLKEFIHNLILEFIDKDR